jgi:hypothetical protein
MRKECSEKVFEKYAPAIRGLGKWRTASQLYLFELYCKCAEDDMDREILKMMMGCLND